jgi:hemoglobin
METPTRRERELSRPDPPPSLDDAALARLVDTFYERVRADAEIGPVFERAVHDWPAHKALLVAFWSSVALGTRRYRGNPMAVHRGVAGIDAAHFERWLALWRRTAADVLDPEAAAAMVAHAERIGRSLREGLGLASAKPLGLDVLR